MATEMQEGHAADWHNQFLLSVIRERARYAREDYQHLSAKLDLAKSELEAKIGKHNQRIHTRGYQPREDYPALDAGMDARNEILLQAVLEQGRQARAAYWTLSAKIDALRYAIGRIP